MSLALHKSTALPSVHSRNKALSRHAPGTADELRSHLALLHSTSKTGPSLKDSNIMEPNRLKKMEVEGFDADFAHYVQNILTAFQGIEQQQRDEKEVTEVNRRRRRSIHRSTRVNFQRLKTDQNREEAAKYTRSVGSGSVAQPVTKVASCQHQLLHRRNRVIPKAPPMPQYVIDGPLPPLPNSTESTQRREACATSRVPSYMQRSHSNVEINMPPWERKCNVDRSTSYSEKDDARKRQVALESYSKMLPFSEDISSSSLRRFIVQELLDTEATYYSHLKSIESLFFFPFDTASRTTKPLVNPEDVNTIFGPIRELILLSAALVRDLKRAMTTWCDDYTKIGKIFLRREALFDSYVLYAINYPESQAALKRNSSKMIYRKFLTEQQKRREKVRLTLADYLIMPVQRITRYSLLLSQLQKHTPPAHPDYVEISAALRSINAVASAANEALSLSQEKKSKRRRS
ncbi:uncharacterized protein VTP21DRAFT_802 [Calcarisporiella thermophila]|uniref:uncharacterized protein n=1 Tax=Calcarisporiella thermophila TaxID=911321 RepID=UPI003743C83D